MRKQVHHLIVLPDTFKRIEKIKVQMAKETRYSVTYDAVVCALLDAYEKSL